MSCVHLRLFILLCIFSQLLNLHYSTVFPSMTFASVHAGGTYCKKHTNRKFEMNVWAVWNAATSRLRLRSGGLTRLDRPTANLRPHLQAALESWQQMIFCTFMVYQPKFATHILQSITQSNHCKRDQKNIKHIKDDNQQLVAKILQLTVTEIIRYIWKIMWPKQSSFTGKI